MKTSGKKSSSSSEDEEEGTFTQAKLQELFEAELKDIYWAEQALVKALPKMIAKATSAELIEALENHLEETEGHVTRVEEVFKQIGVKPEAKKCEAMAGLVKEASEIMEESEEGAMRDAGIISAGQKVEHYEIASYGTLRTFAEVLGHTGAVELLQATLDEEKAADELLSEVSFSVINFDDNESEGDDDDDRTAKVSK